MDIPALQSLLTDIKFEIRNIEEEIINIKHKENTLWEHCNPDDPESYVEFEYLNLVRDSRRLLEKKRKMLSRQSKALKELIRESV